MKNHGLKDSGERQTFDTGAIREPNLGRGRYDLISPIALRKLAMYWSGIVTYYEVNHLNMAMKALQDFLEGERHIDCLSACAYHCFNMIAKENPGILGPDVTSDDTVIRYDMLPVKALKALAIHYERGIGKYSERNWEKGLSLSRHLNSAMRHLQNYLEGDRVEDHLSACVWNVFCIQHNFEMISRGILPISLNDLPNYLEVMHVAR